MHPVAAVAEGALARLETVETPRGEMSIGSAHRVSMCGEVGYNIDGSIAREERCPHVENEDVPHPPVGAQTRLAVDRYGEHSSVKRLPFMMAPTSTEYARRQAAAAPARQC